jgi:uncharacterized iron-regulated membrane protein
MRRALILWHRWFGLVAAAWLLLLAVTGSIVVFYDEIDVALNPDLRRVEAGAAPLPRAALVRSIENAVPGTAIDYLMIAPDPTASAIAFVAPRLSPGQPYPTGYVYRQIYADPYTGRVLGSRVFGEAGLDRRRIAPFLYQLHKDLSLGPVATWLMGLIALGWTLDHVVGAVLAFPSATRWRAAFAVRWRARGHKRTFDLHRAIGLWLYPVTLVLAISGISLTWTETFDRAVGLFSPTSGFPVDGLPVQPQRDYAPATSLDRAIAIAEAQPGTGLVNAVSFHPDLGVYWLRLFDARDLDLLGRRWIVVRYADGAVLADRHERQGSAGDQFAALMLPLHTGKLLGWPGRILIALSGLTLAAVIVTGILIWARKRRARRRRPARQAA